MPEQGARQRALARSHRTGHGDEAARRDLEREVDERRPGRARVGEGDVLERDADRTGAARHGRLLFRAPEPATWPGLKEAKGGSPATVESRRQHGLEPRVGGAAALDRIDELRDAEAALDEADEQRQVSDEGADAHGAVDHAFAALPDDEQDAGHHQRAVERRQAEAQARRAQVALGECPGELLDLARRGRTAAEEAQHAEPGEQLLDARGQRGVRLPRAGRSRRHPAARTRGRSASQSAPAPAPGATAARR